MEHNEKIAIIGAGRVGTALAGALSAKNFLVTAVYDHDLQKAARCAAQCGKETRVLNLPEFPDDISMLFLCVPDDNLANTAVEIADKVNLSSQAVVAHCSGAKGAAVLQPLAGKTEHLASFHPAQTLPGLANDPQRLEGIYFALEGDTCALEKLQNIVQALNSRYVIIPEGKKTLYHLGCVVASNYMIALTDAALEIMRHAGIENREALLVLEPLIRATLDNIIQNGTARAATGPIVRGDTGTVQDHINSLQEYQPALLPIYAELGLQLAQIVDKLPGTDEMKLNRIKKLLISVQAYAGNKNE